jgi:hypothetical protein
MTEAAPCGRGARWRCKLYCWLIHVCLSLSQVSGTAHLSSCMSDVVRDSHVFSGERESIRWPRMPTSPTSPMKSGSTRSSARGWSRKRRLGVRAQLKPRSSPARHLAQLGGAEEGLTNPDQVVPGFHCACSVRIGRSSKWLGSRVISGASYR